MKLAKHLVDKPWGRTDIEPAFGDMGARRIGEIWYEAPSSTPLPILVKWLFTSERLSIQVHPSDNEAKSRGLNSGKEECWFIVDAQPGSVIGIGTCELLTRDQLYHASRSGKIEQLMDWKPVQAGDYYYIPAGTVHAIGAGITLVEVQQHADITFRLYDYGRPRELHLDDAIAVSDARPYDDPRSGHVSGYSQLVEGPYFRLWHIDNAEDLNRLPTDRRRWIVPLKGQVQAGHEIAAVGDCLVIEKGVSVSFLGDAKILIAA
ncbi:MAG: class I mannose-6-phosphate isomerase [Sphingorhabdus sp.]